MPRRNTLLRSLLFVLSICILSCRRDRAATTYGGRAAGVDGPLTATKAAGDGQRFRHEDGQGRPRRRPHRPDDQHAARPVHHRRRLACGAQEARRLRPRDHRDDQQEPPADHQRTREADRTLRRQRDRRLLQRPHGQMDRRSSRRSFTSSPAAGSNRPPPTASSKKTATATSTAANRSSRSSAPSRS